MNISFFFFVNRTRNPLRGVIFCVLVTRTVNILYRFPRPAAVAGYKPKPDKKNSFLGSQKNDSYRRRYFFFLYRVYVFRCNITNDPWDRVDYSFNHYDDG